jgi:mono/diheme cytochrome c family protein
MSLRPTAQLLLVLIVSTTAQVAYVQVMPAGAKNTQPDGGALYTVMDGNKVDAMTLQGWKTWRALACERCHGAQQEGLVGPSLVEGLKQLTKDEFHTTVIYGRPEKGMPAFGGSKMVTENWEGLYAYLKGRSDGKIEPGHLYLLDTAMQTQATGVNR